MNPFNYFLWLLGVMIGLLLGPFATTSAVATESSGQAVYTVGITEEEYNGVYHQTLCYDYMLTRGSIENAVESGLVVEKDGLFYGANAGVSWGACPSLTERMPDVYVTSCTKNIGDMKQTYGYKVDRGWITDENGITVMYLIHAVADHPCDASTIDIFDSSKYRNWYVACQYEPVLFVINGEMARCDANPIRSAAPAYHCDSLVAIKLEGTNSYRFMTNFTVPSGVKVEGINYDFGDGTKGFTNTPEFTHTYAKPGRYVVTATLQVQVPDGITMVATSPSCRVVVAVEP